MHRPGRHVQECSDVVASVQDGPNVAKVGANQLLGLPHERRLGRTGKEYLESPSVFGPHAVGAAAPAGAVEQSTGCGGVVRCREASSDRTLGGRPGTVNPSKGRAGPGPSGFADEQLAHTDPVDRKADRSAHERILEWRAPDVERQELHLKRLLLGDHKLRVVLGPSAEKGQPIDEIDGVSKGSVASERAGK